MWFQKPALSIITAALLFPLLNGCALLPSWRVNQKKVPAPYVKTAKDLESERQSALLISEGMREPAALIPVAKSLSRSLGAPTVPIVARDIAEQSILAVSGTSEVVKHVQQARQKQDDFLNKYQGQIIDHTGIDLFAPAGGLGIIGIVALLVFVPGSLSVLLWIIARLRGTVRTVATGIENFKAAHPEIKEEINTTLSKAMDEVHKKIVEETKVKNNL